MCVVFLLFISQGGQGGQSGQGGGLKAVQYIPRVHDCTGVGVAGVGVVGANTERFGEETRETVSENTPSVFVGEYAV